MELSNLIRDESEITCKIGEGVIQMTYKPSLYTIAYADDLERQTSYDEITSRIFPLISSWDVEEGGKPLELTEQNLRKLPLEWMYEIMTQIRLDVISEKN